MSSDKFDANVFLAYKVVSACVIGDEGRDLGANGKIQKEQEQSEAQPDGA